MTSLGIGLSGLAVTIGLILLRMPIGVTLAGVAFGGVWAIIGLGPALSMLTALPHEFVGNWVLSAVPMFLLMGYVASQAGLASGLFEAMRRLLGGVPGGLACASVGACAVFAAASGSSLATAASMGKIAVPEMRKAGYDDSLSTGCVAASGTLGSLIPPSILMIIYGVFAEVSIGKMFIAAIIPGVLSALVYIVMIVARVKLNPSLAPNIDEFLTWRQKLESMRDVWPFPVLVLAVIGGIFAGVFTPTEAGAIGALIAVLLSFIKRTMTWDVFRRAIVQTVEGTSAIFIIAIGAVLFARFVALSGVPSFVSENLLNADAGLWLFVIQVGIIYLILGMFVDGIGLMLLTLPVVLPAVAGSSVDPIWFGIIVVKLLEIGLATPPVGLNVYVIKGAVGSSVKLSTIFRGALWFVAMDIVVIALLVAIPEIATFLPSLMN